MLSTDVQRESIIKRIEPVVAILMEERPLFKEELNYPEIVKHLSKLFAENLSFEEFSAISDQSLKKRCSGIMSTELIAGMLDDLTPEEMAIFDEAIKRK
ncbi:MAG: hypothetical protein WBM32_07220 [Crocosphaera sp.]|jgi:hypothetical protein